jgi:hypothetical protein
MIDIVMVRDPDSATDIHVWLDGVDVTYSGDVRIIDVDAGAGWEYADWLDARDHADHHLSSDEAKAYARAAYDDPPGYKYIDGWPLEV